MNADRLAQALQAALDWIDAVPKDVVLPAMPGFDRDEVDALCATYRSQSPAEAHGNVLVPLAVLEDASSAIGNFVSDLGWSDADMQALDNLDAYIAQHKAKPQPKGTEPAGWKFERAGDVIKAIAPDGVYWCVVRDDEAREDKIGAFFWTLCDAVAPAPLTSVCHMECDGCIDAGKCAFPGKPAEPARYPHPDEDDAVTLWAEIHRLRAAVQGPDGYATWQEAATAERVRRVAAEKALAEAQAPAPAPETGDTNGRRDGLRSAVHGRVAVGGYTPGALADLLWASPDVMSLNAELGLSMDQLAQLTQAVLTAVPCAAVGHDKKPVASIYVGRNGEREFDDWKCPLPVGRNELYTGPQDHTDAMRLALASLETCTGVPHWPLLRPTIDALRAALGDSRVPVQGSGQ